MSAQEAREKIGRCFRVATGRARIEVVELQLGIKLVDALRDDDLTVIFAEHLAPVETRG